MPGFHVRQVATVNQFITSIAVDSHGILYLTGRDGDLVRFGDPRTEFGPGATVTHLPTHGEGNSGLIGMALRDDDTAIVHYTTPNQTYDVVSAVDLRSGRETEIHRFVCDITLADRGSSTEHHGGNLFVTRDGTIFLGIGDYGVGLLAPDPAWNAGKLWRIAPDGTTTMFARGFRNPFDLAWDEGLQRVVIADNGDVVDDEINVIAEGDDAGWPFTAGGEPPVAGKTPPVYVFPKVVAPTGLVQLSGRNALLHGGYLLSSYVTKAIYYIPDIRKRPLPAPIPLVQGDTLPIIDVTEGPDGRIWFATFNTIYELVAPVRVHAAGR